MSSPYLIWTAVPEGNACLLWPPENIDRHWEIHDGLPRADGFPLDALFRMSKDHRRSIALLDSAMNLADHTVVSAKLKDFLASKCLKNVEFLPVSILNHKGRIASRDYFIVHPILPQDCLDIEKSGVHYNHIIPTFISFVDQITLDLGRLDPEVRLFRIKNFGIPVFVERTLANEILDSGFTGLTFIEPEDFRK